MDSIFSLIKFFMTSELVAMGLILMFFAIYKNFIKPKLERLEQLEKEKNDDLLLLSDSIIKNIWEMKVKEFNQLMEKIQEIDSLKSEIIEFKREFSNKIENNSKTLDDYKNFFKNNFNLLTKISEEMKKRNLILKVDIDNKSIDLNDLISVLNELFKNDDISASKLSKIMELIK